MSPNFLRTAPAAKRRSFNLLPVLIATMFFMVSGLGPLRSMEPPPARNPVLAGHHLNVSATLESATVGVAYNAVISVNGGSAPYVFHAQELPAGLAINTATGAISGAPIEAGQFSFAIWVTDNSNDQGLGWLALTVANGKKKVVGISITPTSASVNSGATEQFQATVTNSSDKGVTWSASQGSVSSEGLFTAPSVTANTTVTITATSAADKTKSASASVSVVAKVTSSAVSLEVLFPPTNPNTSDFKAVQTYLMNNPIVSGGNLAVEWGMIDQGPGTNPQYDWSTLDSDIAPWVAAGKKVNLIIWANSDSTTATCSNGAANTTGNCGIPSYVWTAMGPSNYTTCTTQYGTQQIPNYFDRAGFQLHYQQFMVATLQKYGSDPNIGYIRFGLGHGGESYPVTGWNSTTTACGKAFTSWGVTITTWETYLAGMMDYESTLHSAKQLMVGVTPMGAPTTVVPDYVAPLAVPMHIGLGSQGFEQSDITNYPNCTANWCNLFALYAGQAPLELQTYLQSCPDNSCTTGSLVNLVPFAVSHHATVLEIYYQDWLLAFDPSYPGNSEYGAAYAQVLTQAAKGK